MTKQQAVKAQATLIREIFEQASKMGLRDTDLALQSGVPKDRISKIRRGLIKQPTYITVYMLLKAVGL